MTEPNIWYVSATSQKGFTADIDHAMRDQLGHPVLADGNVKLLLGRQYRDFQRALDVQEKAKALVWEALLDEMEEEYSSGSDREAIVFSQQQQRGLVRALAILEYRHDYLQDKDKTIDRILQEARVRYEQESEG